MGLGLGLGFGLACSTRVGLEGLELQDLMLEWEQLLGSFWGVFGRAGYTNGRLVRWGNGLSNTRVRVRGEVIVRASGVRVRVEVIVRVRVRVMVRVKGHG